MVIKPIELSFQGVRVYFPSQKSYDQVLASLLEEIGDAPVELASLVQDHITWEGFRDEAEKLAGPSGFMQFALIDHGGWMAKAGPFRRSARIILGNPVLAITMLEHDLSAGLFAPVEALLIETGTDNCTLLYVKPSSAMVVEPNEELLKAAQNLDDKFFQLASKVTNT